VYRFGKRPQKASDLSKTLTAEGVLEANGGTSIDNAPVHNAYVVNVM